MIILGLDPGIATTGYGIIKKEGSKLIPISYGIISTPASNNLPSRLNELHQSLTTLLLKNTITEIGIEALFFNINKKTALTVAHARGIMLLAAEQQKIPCSAYTPPQIKAAVSGEGKASKKQVQYMVKQLLNLDHTPKPDDAADALAVAICHAHKRTISSLSKQLIY